MSAASGKRLRAFIERAATGDMTQSELAARFGVTRTALQAWYSGVNEPSLASITAIASFAGVPRWRVLAAYDGDGPA